MPVRHVRRRQNRHLHVRRLNGRRLPFRLVNRRSADAGANENAGKETAALRATSIKHRISPSISSESLIRAGSYNIRQYDRPFWREPHRPYSVCGACSRWLRTRLRPRDRRNRRIARPILTGRPTPGAAGERHALASPEFKPPQSPVHLHGRPACTARSHDAARIQFIGDGTHQTPCPRKGPKTPAR